MKPQLNDAGKAGLNEERGKWVLPEISKEVPVDHALGGLVTVGDVPDGRAEGAMAWDGYSNSNWVSPLSKVIVQTALPPFFILTFLAFPAS